MTKRSSLVCIYEDRLDCEPGIRLLIESLTRCCPDIHVDLYFEGNSAFVDWLSSKDNIRLSNPKSNAASGWNVKPTILLTGLGRGYDEVIWVDSDVVFVRDWRSLAATIPLDTVIATEEGYWGARDDYHGYRAREWSLEVGRSLPTVINSCFLRVTRDHQTLLSEWHYLLQTPNYVSIQNLPPSQRPLAFMGDQDVLTALLSSKPFASLPLVTLRIGHEIIQAFGLKGFTVSERVNYLFGKGPIIVHQQGAKPWSVAPYSGRGLLGYLLRVYLDVSPYIHFANIYKGALQGQTVWLFPSSRISKALIFIGFKSYQLTGFPLALAFDCLFYLLRFKRLIYRWIAKTGLSRSA